MGRTVLTSESLESASSTRGGKVTSSTQTIAGNKTFTGTITLSSLTPSRNLELDGSGNIIAVSRSYVDPVFQWQNFF